MQDPAQLILMYFIVPLWLIAGFADWCCHRNSHISTTSGVKESAIHLLMFIEVGIPLLLVLFFEVNALVILISILVFFVHEITALWDVGYASKHRKVGPVEQHVHSFLEMIPLMALLLIIATHWLQFLALFNSTSIKPEYSLQLKSPSLPHPYLLSVLLSIVVIVIIPYMEEFRRCYKKR